MVSLGWNLETREAVDASSELALMMEKKASWEISGEKVETWKRNREEGDAMKTEAALRLNAPCGGAWLKEVRAKERHSTAILIRCNVLML